MHFRAALPSDAAKISALIMSFQSQLTLHLDGRGAEQFFASVSEESECGYIESARYEYLLAEENNDLAGFVAIRDKTQVFHLFVAPHFQHAGLARDLWNRVCRPAVRYTVNASLDAIPAYERFGFVVAGPQQQAHGIVFQPMQLELAENGA